MVAPCQLSAYCINEGAAPLYTGGAVLRQYFSDAELLLLSKEMDPAQPTGHDYYPLTKPGTIMVGG